MSNDTTILERDLREYLQQEYDNAHEKFVTSDKLRSEALALGRHNAMKDVIDWLDNYESERIK